jgi:two-component system chemotaxis sensor kinase CheA
VKGTIVQTFREEAVELLGELEMALLDLEDRLDDPDAVDRVFRALHTLKGSGGMAGFDSLAEAVHEIETEFEKVRNGELTVNRNLVSQTLAVKDLLMMTIEAGSDAGCFQKVAEVVEAYRALNPQKGRAKTAPTSPRYSRVSAEDLTYRIRFRPGKKIFRRGINPVALLRELSLLGECRVAAQTGAVPPLGEIEPELCYLCWDIILTTGAGENAIRDVFIFVEDDSELSLEVVDGKGTKPILGRLGEVRTERGDLTHIGAPGASGPGKRIGGVHLAEGPAEMSRIGSAFAEGEQGEKIRRERHALANTGSIRIQSNKLDQLVDLVGELVTVQARLSQTVGARNDGELNAIAEEVERLTWELRDQVLNARMLPIGAIFDKFRRLVRDLAGELEKDVELITEGADTELDKTVIERIYDPLVHLIRNGIDHGIEPPMLRKASGKPSRGKIRLSAIHSGPNVLIRIGDDGRGLDREAIKVRAASKGAIPAGAELSDKEIFDLAFLPGLSTATQVTSVSGRGVGMDVVRQAIEGLGGSIETESDPGEGTSFTIKLPLTLAIIDGLLVKIGGDQFVMPLASVEECIELTRHGQDRAYGRNLVSLRGEIIPYLRLRETFGTEGGRPPIEQVVIACLENRRFGFVVDNVVGEHQTVIKPLGRMYRKTKGFSGATVLGDGNVALILDLPQLVKLEEASADRIVF